MTYQVCIYPNREDAEVASVVCDGLDRAKVAGDAMMAALEPFTGSAICAAIYRPDGLLVCGKDRANDPGRADVSSVSACTGQTFRIDGREIVWTRPLGGKAAVALDRSGDVPRVLGVVVGETGYLGGAR